MEAAQSGPPESISFDPARRLFVLRLRHSVYTLRLLESGEVVQAGFSPLPAALDSEQTSLALVDDYKEVRDLPFDRQKRRYEYPAAGDVTYHEAAIRVLFYEPPALTKPGEVFHDAVRDLRPRYVSHEVLLDAEPALSSGHGGRSTITQPRQTLAIHLRDTSYDFDLTLFYRITSEHDIIERWVEVRNATKQSVKVERLDFGCLAVPDGTTRLVRVAGCWGREFTPIHQELEPGVLVLEQLGLNTGHTSNPFFFLHRPGGAIEEAGSVWFGALAYSGNWTLRFECRSDSQVRVFGGYAGTDFEIALAPGETHRTPAMIIGCSAEGFGGASRRLHRFTRERVLPSPSREAFRPVLYNSWSATHFDISEENQIRLADAAAALGVELFCVDDGWFGTRCNDKSGLGDWWPRREVFPRGIKPLADHVHNLGMKFGLWVEPEMVSPDSDLYRAHPDWVLHYPGRPRTEERSELVLDLARPEVVEHLFSALERLVVENGIDFFKWDMNRSVAEAGSVAGRGIWQAHVAAVYALMDRLRAAHRYLEIQSCSGGGGRLDLGILARCDQAWVSDNTDAGDRTVIQDGVSLAYPSRVMECWVTQAKDHLTERILSTDLRFDVAMRGVLGIGIDLNALAESELTIYRRKIAFYKRLRPVVQNGDLYRLESITHGDVSTWLFVAPDRTAAVYSNVILHRRLGISYAASILCGLDPSILYRVVDEHLRELGRYPGWQLMTMGLPDDSGGRGPHGGILSRTLLLERI